LGLPQLIEERRVLSKKNGTRWISGGQGSCRRASRAIPASVRKPYVLIVMSSMPKLSFKIHCRFISGSGCGFALYRFKEAVIVGLLILVSADDRKTIR